MKKILIIVNIFLCVIAGLAQTPIDTTVLVCEYKYTYVLDPATNKGGMETMRLEIGKMQNMFYNPNNESFNARLENFNNVDISNQADVATALQMIQSGGKRFNYDAAFKIYSDYAKSKIVVTDQIRIVKYQYTEDIEKIDWKLYDETMEIIGYTCKKATCKFRGRDYEAWYTVDIPINKGP
jgi:GLPGLI family protein